MKNYMHSGNLDLADGYMEKGNYGSARCEFRECLAQTVERDKDNKDKIEYLQRKILECDERGREECK